MYYVSNSIYTNQTLMFIPVKGNQQRPTCSRCQEAGVACVYSSKRRKPGPPKGVRRKRHSPQTGPGIIPDPAQLVNELNSEIFPSQEIGTASTNIDFPSESAFADADAFFGLNFSDTHLNGVTQIQNTYDTSIEPHDLPFTAAEELDM